MTWLKFANLTIRVVLVMYSIGTAGDLILADAPSEELADWGQIIGCIFLGIFLCVVICFRAYFGTTFIWKWL